MIVADVNTIAYLWLPNDHTEPAWELLNQDGQWVAPMLWRSEFRNVLAVQMHVGKLQLQNALDIFSEAERLMDGHEYNLSTQMVLGLANQTKCTAYDCEYVALANEMNVKLITYDKQIIREFPAVAMTAEQYLASLSK